MSAVERFAEAASRPDADLAQAALLIAAGADETLDVNVWLREFDVLAEGVHDLTSLRHRLFGERGLRGNTAAYGDPENSFLHRVLERGLGIPISLSVIAMEVGRRAGIPIEGVGMPGHFLARERTSGVLFDPFDTGVVIDVAGAEARWRRATGARDDDTFDPSAMLRPVSTTEILARMLGNLRAEYGKRGQAGDVEWVIRMRLALPGADPRDVLTLAEALAMQGRTTEGAAEIVRHAEEHPEVRETLTQAARALRARLN